MLAKSSDLSFLSELSLERSHLTRLPDTFGNLINLQELNLGDSNLETLPDHLGRLCSLQYWDVSMVLVLVLVFLAEMPTVEFRTVEQLAAAPPVWLLQAHGRAHHIQPSD